MGKQIDLTASDGFKLAAYLAEPAGKAKAGLLVIQEIFGVNAHIRELCDGFAKDGYAALAPALFDRAKRGVELGYEQADIAKGREIRQEVPWDKAVLDCAAGVDYLKRYGKVGSTGYCWGGSVSYLCGTRLPVNAAVVYYGGQIIPFNDEKLKAPCQMHFGETDAGIPLSDVEQIKAKHPEAEVFVYQGAGHGFTCDHRGSYHAAATRQARERTMAFFAKHL